MNSKQRADQAVHNSKLIQPTAAGAEADTHEEEGSRVANNRSIRLLPKQLMSDKLARSLVLQIQHTQGNAAAEKYITAQRSLADNLPVTSERIVQRHKGGTITFPPDTIYADPVVARSNFARIKESVQNYSDNALDYFSNQYFSAMTSFQQWYNRQDRADVSFFNAVINLIMNSAWAWGSPGVGAVAAPVGSVIMLVAQEAARVIQASRDEFAASLVRSANNFQSGVQQKLRGKIPNLIERKDRSLWEEIQRNAYLGEEWQPILHQRAGLPQPGQEYHQRLLSDLIFAYREWELSNQLDIYRGVYSMADPELRHMRGRAEAEAYVESGRPIPRRLKAYAHPDENVAAD
jgi:hypothetical protein